MIAALLFGVVAGMCVTVQTGLNNVLGKTVPSIWVTLVSHLGGAIFATLVIVGGAFSGMKDLKPSFSQISTAPWYSFTGGIFGVAIVAAVLASVRSVPIATTLAMVVTGEFIASIVIEQAGLFGLQPHPMGMARMIGIVMICGGTYLLKQV